MRLNRSFDRDAHVLPGFTPRLVCAGQVQRYQG
jgi:hypothetical protein